MTITLKYPEGEFTQAELAVFNGQEKLAVYLPMKEAIEKGVIIKTGTRPTGKRPANVYRIADNNAPVPVQAPVVPPPIVETPSVQSVVPVAIPVVQVTIPVITVAAPVVPPAVPVINLAPDAAYPCNLCGGPMTVIPDATGVMVKCYNPLPCIPGCNENPYGHGKNAKDAWETSKEKFYK